MKINEALVTCLCKRLVLIPRPASQIQRSQIYLRRPVTGQWCVTVSSCIQLRLQASSWSQNVTMVQLPLTGSSLVARRPHSHFWPCHASRGPFQPRHDSTPRCLFLHCFCSWVKKKISHHSHHILFWHIVTYLMQVARCIRHQSMVGANSNRSMCDLRWDHEVLGVRSFTRATPSKRLPDSDPRFCSVSAEDILQSTLLRTEPVFTSFDFPLTFLSLSPLVCYQP